MSGKYDDIIHLPHHMSIRHAPMSMIDRAAQFSPFAALTGYDAVIRETARLTDNQNQLCEDAIKMLDEKIQLLNDQIDAHPMVSITFFQPDTRKSGGSCIEITGKAVKIDQLHQVIIFEDGTTIFFDKIITIDSPILESLEP